ncbi:MAG: helix-turn-helix transcriptional regulator [Clostridia bacterium]|nr:helix-turn-helix transcriptional regulator [Clostridia bacterium]
MKEIILPQIVSLGIYNAQLVIKNRTTSQNRKTTMFEIELPMEEGGISYIDSTSHPIVENVVICAKPGQIRHTKLPFRCYYVHLIVNEGQLYEVLSALPNYMEIERTDEVREIFLSMIQHYHTGISEESIMLQSLILRLVHTLKKNAPNHLILRKPKHNNRIVIEQTLNYINENIAEELTLESLSERAKFSPIYFHKLFKASTGKNLHEYVEEQRLRKAIDLLLSTEMTLAQIAYECGFSSQSYFSYAFKKKMQMTPREYAKNMFLKYEK